MRLLSEIYVEGSSLVKVQKSESKINKTVLCFYNILLPMHNRLQSGGQQARLLFR